VLAVLIIGGLIGSQIERKLFLKNSTEVAQVPTPVAKKVDIKFVIPGRKNTSASKTEVMKELEKKLSSTAYTLSFYINNDGPNRKYSVDRIQTQIGMVDTSRIFELQKNGSDISPVFLTSPRPEVECYAEIQVVTTKQSPINSLNELEKKNLGVAVAAIPLANFIFKNLKEQNITASKIVMFTELSEGLSDLNSGKFDAIVTRATTFNNNEVASKIGEVKDNSFVNHPELKIISTSENKIPCNTIFFSNVLPESVKTALTLKFASLITTRDGEQLMSEAIGVRYVYNVDPVKWKEVERKLASLQDFQLSSFAPEIISR
jgi:hypothetical protein